MQDNTPSVITLITLSTLSITLSITLITVSITLITLCIVFRVGFGFVFVGTKVFFFFSALSLDVFHEDHVTFQTVSFTVVVQLPVGVAAGTACVGDRFKVAVLGNNMIN